MTDTTVHQPPAAPIGYRPLQPFHYPKLALEFAAVALLIVITPLLLLLLWAMQGREVYPSVTSPVDLLLALAAIVATVVMHELIHGLAYQLLGYRVAYGVSLRLLAAYAGAFGQWQQRDHNLVVALAPLLLLTPLLLPLLASDSPTLVLATFTALLFNTAGAVGDLYLAARLLRWPPRTLLYDVDIHHMYVALPEGERGKG